MLKRLILLLMSFTAMSGVFAYQPPDFLPVGEAFQFEAVETVDGVLVHMRSAKGYYLYKDRIGFAATDRSVLLSDPVMPVGVERNDEYFGLVTILEGDKTARVPMKNTNHRAFTLEVRFQGCAEKGLCYPPDTKSIHIPATAGSAVTLLTGRMLFIEFLSGARMVLTPTHLAILLLLCSVLLHGRLHLRRSLIVSLTHVTATVICFTVASTATGYYGASLNLQSNLQSQWILIPLASLLFIFSAFVSGLISTARGSAVDENSDEEDNLRFSLTWFAGLGLGVISGLLASTSLTSPLARTLVYINASGDAIGGAMQLLALGLGMCVPLILLAACIYALLSKTCRHIRLVHDVSAMAMAAVAAWMLQRVLPAPASIGLWGVLAVIVAVKLGTVDSVRNKPFGWGRRIVGLVFLCYGLAAWVGMLKGEPSLRFPIANAPESISTQTWKTASTYDELQRALKDAKASGAPAVVQWYADWCLSCEVMRDTLNQTNLSDKLGGAHLIRFDLSHDTVDQRHAMAINGLVVPAAVQFFTSTGTEVEKARIIGEAPSRIVYQSLTSY